MDPLDHIIYFLKQTDELQTASTLLKTFKKYSTELQQYDQLGRAFHDVKDYKESLDCTEKCLALAKTPGEMFAIRANLAKLYNHTNQPQKAIQYIDANLAVDPNDYEAKMEKVFSYYLAAEPNKSKELTEELLADPNTPDNVRDRCEFNYGSYQLDAGEFKKGLRGFVDVGHKLGIWPKAKLHGKEWDGSIIPGATIAFVSEGGIGDEVINVRFMKHISDRGMNPIYLTHRKDVADLFNFSGLPTVTSLEEVPKDALWARAMYLPISLDLDKNDLWYGSYLKPNPIYVKKWKRILPQGKKIAIKWSGNPRYEQDLHRSVPLSKLNEVLDFSRTDATIVSVQKEYYDELEKYPQVFNAAPYLETLEDLLACLSLMDYTISSCTSVAHIAGAAGLPITVCPPVATYYLWLGDAKWYGDNCTVLRQRKWNDWEHLNQIKV